MGFNSKSPVLKYAHMITYTIETSVQNEEQLGFDSCKGNKKICTCFFFNIRKQSCGPFIYPLFPLPHQCLSVLERPPQQATLDLKFIKKANILPVVLHL